MSRAIELGIFARTYSRSGLEELLDAIEADGLRTIQFNFATLGLPTLPAAIDPKLLETLRTSLDRRRIRVAAVSATFNLIHPDPVRRKEGLDRLPTLARCARALGCDLLTLCTGSLNPDDMWWPHPDNQSAAAWETLNQSLGIALESTDDTGVRFGIEPEGANVVHDALAARRLLDVFKNPRLRIIMDPASLLDASNLARQREILHQAFELLGTDIALAHAKEIGADGKPSEAGPGKGVLDWDHFLLQLGRVGYRGALIVHGLSEAGIGDALAYLRERIRNANIHVRNRELKV